MKKGGDRLRDSLLGLFHFHGDGGDGGRRLGRLGVGYDGERPMP